MKDVFGRAFVLLRSNWIIVVPSLAVGIVSAVAAYALAASGALSWGFFGDMDAQGPQAFWMFAQTIVALGLRILGTLVAIAFTTGMAGAAWETGRTSLADGLDAFRRRGAQAAAALALLFVVGLGAAALVVPTFGISVLLYMVFILYTMPAVIVGGRDAIEGIVESIRTAAHNFGLTLAVVVLIVLLAAAGGLAGDAAGRIPLLGELVGWLVMEAVVAYATLVVVGEYLKLSRAQDQAP